jgi:glycosyltransferase involved in cell wall biosynthesis
LTDPPSSEEARRELEEIAREVAGASGDVRRAQRSQAWRVGSAVSRAARIVTFGHADPDLGALDAAAGSLESLERRLARWSEPPQAAQPPRRLRITVVAWDMGHNAVIRAYYLADMLSREHNVELVGPNFPQHGTQIWEPIRPAALRTRSFPGRDLPEFVHDAERFIRHRQPDLVYVYKPRFPSLLLGMLLKHRCGVPVIVDIDESELAFVPSDERISLDELERRRSRPDFCQPWGDSWTAAADGLVSDADAVIVNSETLQPLYGGTILPQVRDERAFDPGRFDRDALRSELGFSRQDRVVLFAGSAKQHKGLQDVFRALEQLQDPRYRLCVVGSIADPELEAQLSAAPRVKLIGFRPVSEIPALTIVGDLVCLPQDLDSEITRHQTPGKLTEALAMGVPVLAEQSPPLAPFAARGLIHVIGAAPLAQRISELFDDAAGMRGTAQRGRKFFLERLSYAAGIKTFDRVVAELDWDHRELSPNWRRAYQLARAPTSCVVEPARGGSPGRSRASRGWDVVFFWRLNDSGLYGRRPDMLMKYLAQADWTRRLIHFDSPIDWDWIEGRKARENSSNGFNQWRMIRRRAQRQALLGERHGKLRSYTFVARSAIEPPLWQRALLPTAEEYLGFAAHVLKRNDVGERPLLFWVWPPDFDFLPLHQALTPTLTIADVVDDRRSWESAGTDTYEAITRNYETVLGRSDIVLTHSEPLRERLKWFGVEPHVVPNGLELFPARNRSTRRPPELRHLHGPLIGYVGGLSFRLDIPLLDRLARERRDCQLILIGSADGPSDVLSLAEHPNVHFLGVKRYPDVVRYIRAFDVAIIPHLDNDMTRGMSPLKAFVYASCGVPVIATEVANLVELKTAIRVAGSHDEFIAVVAEELERRRRGEHSAPAQSLLERHTWTERVRQIERLIDNAVEQQAPRQMPVPLGR